ncbi:MAG: IreB family regulatory phosphoprotein [Finegoldia magna]|nr:IreB family regulatory phosphoprotein [Finegoldia magna]
MEGKDLNHTVRFEASKLEQKSIKETLKKVYQALEEKGYDPKNQIIGYILSGDTTYITSFNNARNLIRQIDRDDLLGEMLEVYLNEIDK